MGVLDRLNRLVKSNLNDLVSRMQDPAKEVDLLIDEMQAAAVKARAEVATCLAHEKRLQAEVTGLREQGKDWGARAERAVLAGDDALAREALARQAEVDRKASESARALEDQRSQSTALTEALRQVEARVKEVGLRRGTLRDQARRNAGQDPTSTQSKAFTDFARFESGVDAQEAHAQLDEELLRDQGRDPTGERKLRDLERNAGVEDALAALKRKLEE